MKIRGLHEEHGKKKLKGERLGCGIGRSASPACIPPCFILMIAASTAVPNGASTSRVPLRGHTARCSPKFEGTAGNVGAERGKIDR